MNENVPSPIDFALMPLKRYFKFSGRATRGEYGWFSLLAVILIAGAYGVQWVFKLPGFFYSHGISFSTSWLVILVSFFLFMPWWAVTVRRLHDCGKSGLWSVIFFLAMPLVIFWEIGQTLYALLSIFALGGFAIIAVGFAYLAFCLYREGETGDNKYGSDPNKCSD